MPDFNRKFSVNNKKFDALIVEFFEHDQAIEIFEINLVSYESLMLEFIPQRLNFMLKKHSSFLVDKEHEFQSFLIFDVCEHLEG
jgi:hypothetical protein